ncbi:MAG: cupin domain-containing protein [Deltaproteobacteria bacterium]|nr:cupin domain-containing protein [Deltaproteobacteria bacterium]
MEIHADLERDAIIAIATLPWVPTPAAGVERRMLERDGDEVARATSVVRYARGCSFPAHEHGGGEEFLVLAGRFDDEHGQYEAGTYVRNPPGSRHAPSAALGCTIFVKLRQFAGDDTRSVVVRPQQRAWVTLPSGMRRCELHAHGAEAVALLELPVGFEGELPAGTGAGWELLLCEGTLEAAGVELRAPAWWRRAAPPARVRSAAGAQVWTKTGHFAARR